MMYPVLGCPIQDKHLLTGESSVESTKMVRAGAIALWAEGMGQVQPGEKMPTVDSPAASTVHGDVLKKTMVRLFTSVLGEGLKDGRQKLKQGN